MTEENFNAVTKVFGPVTTLIQTSLGPKRKDSTFEEAVEEFQHYMSQPGP